MVDLKSIDKTWTLFIDRDGVINEEKLDDYIHNWEQFIFYPDTKLAFKLLSDKFGRIIVVTNQRGIGKGLTKLENVEEIHSNMMNEISKAGGRIDKIYFCPEIEDSNPNRKPNPGMGLQALKDFPDIELSKSVMIGNTLGDMEFGRNLGVAATIFVATTRKDTPLPHSFVDFVFDDLYAVARAMVETTT
jgi:D-glycero-D-manno-heptose 1,7-bisphosphate phosphatase